MIVKTSQKIDANQELISQELGNTLGDHYRYGVVITLLFFTPLPYHTPHKLPDLSQRIQA